MRVDDVISELRPRAQTLGLIDTHTGYADESEVRFYLLRAMRELAVEFQLDMFLTMNRELLRTVDGVEDYTIPPNFWGWWSPHDGRSSGLYVASVVAATTTALASTDDDALNLLYRDPARYHRERTIDEAKPSIFTVAENKLWFSPIPDAVYIIQGVHRTALETADEVPDPYVPAVQARTLYMMAGDKDKITPELVRANARLVGKLVNDEARLHMQFRRPYEWGGRFGMRARRYGTGGW